MHAGPTIETERLVLRRWRDADREPFAALNADPHVMEFMPKRLERAESDALIDRIEGTFDQHGFGFWAVEVRGGAPFAGFVGLSVPRFDAHFTPCVEIGWRLAVEQQGHGYATEGARAALAFGFEQAGLDEIVAFTTPKNAPSLHVMEKLGMRRDPADDFEHPLIEVGHPLRHLVLYRVSAAARRSS